MTQAQLKFVAGSDTSKEAAESMEPHFTRQQRRVYLWACLQRQGFTDEEGANALKMNSSSFRPRRIELVEMGALMALPEKRKTSSGRNATAWVVA